MPQNWSAAPRAAHQEANDLTESDAVVVPLYLLVILLILASSVANTPFLCAPLL